jgi:hypothetical protein
MKLFKKTKYSLQGLPSVLAGEWAENLFYGALA